MGPFEPGSSVLMKKENKVYRECGGLEIDCKWEDIFGITVSNACMEQIPET